MATTRRNSVLYNKCEGKDILLFVSLVTVYVHSEDDGKEHTEHHTTLLFVLGDEPVVVEDHPLYRKKECMRRSTMSIAKIPSLFQSLPI